MSAQYGMGQEVIIQRRSRKSRNHHSDRGFPSSVHHRSASGVSTKSLLNGAREQYHVEVHDRDTSSIVILVEHTLSLLVNKLSTFVNGPPSPR
jgi:hypothetical protein